jgi:2-dehydro-3-deoxyphosphogluconate aldolase / (4S)-4-hydroxy-2-oxoglutarate aldolase
MPSHFEILSRLIAGKVVAVVRLDSGDQLIKVAEALKAGGVTAIEFTVPTPGALDMIKQASAYFGDEVIMGAGTVLDAETARAAILSGRSLSSHLP